MPTVELDKKDLMHFIGKDFPDEKLKEKIPMLGTDLEKIDGNTVTVEIFPDRPDMLCEEGLGRALQGFLGVKKGPVRYNVKKGQYKVIVDKEMESIKPYVGFAVLKGVKFTDTFIKSHMQLQDKLSTTHCRKRKKAGMGVYDLAKIKFPIKFKSIGSDDKFIPLLLNKEMKVIEIIEKHPKGKEYGHLLKGKRYAAFVDAEGKIMGMPPITQADFSKVTENTKDILVEVTGADWKVMIQLLNILVCNWAERGAEIHSVQIEYPYKTPAGQNITMPQLEPVKTELDIGYVNKLLGLKLTAKEAAELLERMRCGTKVQGNKISVEVPCYRTDILHAADLIEDIAIAYGYENFKPEIPKVATISEENPKSLFTKKVAETAVGLGLLECVNYHLTNKNVLFKNMNIKEDKNVVKAMNAVNIEYNTVRNALMPMLLKVLGENKHHEYPQELFEIGEVVSAKDEKIIENVNIAITLAHTGADFTEIRSMAEALLDAIGHKPEFKPTEHPSFIEGRASEIIADGKKLGVLGEIHPQVLNNFEIEQPVAAMEIKLNLLL